MRKTLTALALAAATVLGAAACSASPSSPTVESDSNSGYGGNARVLVDTNVYDITGTVTADVKSLTRQTAPAHGSISGGLYGNGFGYVGGSFFGPVEAGKGFVRITVKTASPSTDLAPVGDTVILKVTDTKGTALLPGDTVRFRCRRQFEAVAAVLNNQRFNAKADGTWELDYCRLATPVITVGGSGQ